MGVPTETVAELKQTRDMMLQLTNEHPNCIIFPPNKFRPLPGTELYGLAKNKWGYEMPNSLDQWANIEVEAEADAGWYTAEHLRFFNLMLICSYFIDNKVARMTTGKTMFFKVMRLLNFLYRPIAVFRLKHGLSRFLFEYPAYRTATRMLTRAEKAG
jgi:hypothetical protein